MGEGTGSLSDEFLIPSIACKNNTYFRGKKTEVQYLSKTRSLISGRLRVQIEVVWLVPKPVLILSIVAAPRVAEELCVFRM